MEQILDLIKQPYRRKYAEKHGIESLMNIFDTCHWKDAKAEEIYKYCLDNNIKWEKYLKIKDDVIT